MLLKLFIIPPEIFLPADILWLLDDFESPDYIIVFRLFPDPSESKDYTVIVLIWF